MPSPLTPKETFHCVPKGYDNTFKNSNSIWHTLVMLIYMLEGRDFISFTDGYFEELIQPERNKP